MQGFKRGGAVHSDARVTTFRIVPAFYPLEYGIGKLVASFPCSGVEQLHLHGSPERLHHRIIVAITDRTHRAEQPGRADALPERP